MINHLKARGRELDFAGTKILLVKEMQNGKSMKTPKSNLTELIKPLSHPLKLKSSLI
jgi:hypothetical protein